MRAVALGGVAAFVVLVAVQHPLRSDLPPLERFVSEYAVGWTAPLQAAAFLCWAASMAAAAVLAARARPAGRPVARGLTVLALAVATGGALLAALFPTQTVAGELPAGVVRTLGGRLHDLGTLFILAGLVVAALAALRLVRRRGYRIAVPLLGLGLLAIVPVLVALGIDAPGLGQRGFILVGCLWQWAFVVGATSPAS